jgi:cell division protein ZapA
MTTQHLTEATVEILGKSYQIKCPTSELQSLQRAANRLDEQMRALRDSSNILSIDRIAIITALNVVNQMLTFEQSIQQKLHELESKLDRVLSPAPEEQLAFA